MLVIPTVAQLADWSGRPESSYTTYANSALLQATIMFSTVTELTVDDMAALLAAPDTTDYQLAIQGILSMADWIYLRQPYQQMVAAPLMSESIGSYSYSKAMSQVARNAAAMEISGESSGVVMYDLAVQYLAKRTRAGGVFSGAITVFETPGPADQVELLIRNVDGRLTVLGPGEHDTIDVPFDVNSEIAQ